MEALLLTFNVACMTYLCWRIFKSIGKKESKADVNLGFFAIREQSSMIVSGVVAEERKNSDA